MCVDFIVRLLETRDIAYNESLKRFKAGRPGDLPCNKTVPLDFVMINVTVSKEATSMSFSAYLPTRSMARLSLCLQQDGRCCSTLPLPPYPLPPVTAL